MRQGRTLEDLARELGRQREASRDFLVPAPKVRIVDTRPAAEMSALLDEMIEDAKARAAKRKEERAAFEREEIPGLELEVAERREIFPIGPHAHGQMADRLGIPQAFYRRMLLPEHRPAYLNLVNHLAERQAGVRMIRTLDGQVRADLSNSYRPLGNLQLLDAILPALMRANCRIVSCEVTATRLYIKAVSQDLEGELGDPGLHLWHKVRGGISIANSEVGAGKVILEGLLDVDICSNLAMVGTRFARTHLGRKLGDLEEASEFFTDATREADDRAFFLKVQDVVAGLLSHQAFTGLLDSAKGKLAGPQVADPVAAVEVAKRTLGLADSEALKVRNLLIQQASIFGLGKWGLSNAVTEYAKTSSLSYDRTSELEAIGGRVIELPAQEWKRIATAEA